MDTLAIGTGEIPRLIRWKAGTVRKGGANDVMDNRVMPIPVTGDDPSRYQARP